MSLPFYGGNTPAGGIPSPGYASLSRTWLQGLAGTVSSWVKLAGNPVKSISQPVNTIADTTVKAVDKSVGAVVSGFKWGTAILLILAGLLVFVYLRPFLPTPSK